MCARFTLQTPAEEVADTFDIADIPRIQPLFNIAPTSMVTVVGQRPKAGGRGFASFKWGFVPNWSNVGTYSE